MQTQPSLLERILLIVPWLFPVWLISKGINGEIDGLLVFVLLIIAIPVIFFINIVTVVFVRGRSALQQIKQATGTKAKKPLKSINYSDLPWWDIRKWRK